MVGLTSQIKGRGCIGTGEGSLSLLTHTLKKEKQHNTASNLGFYFYLSFLGDFGESGRDHVGRVWPRPQGK